MNQRLNLRSLRFNWLVTRWASLALPLACSVVIGSSGPARGDVVVWDTGPFCADCQTTNIVFVSLEQFDAFTNSIARQIFDAYGSLDVVTNRIALVRVSLSDADGSLDDALQQSNVPYLTVLDIRAARRSITNDAPAHLQQAEEYAVRAKSDLQEVRAAFYNGVDTTRAEVATACESSGGCVCQCPDYTALLQTIIGHLSSIRVDVNNTYGYIQTFYWWLCDLYDDGSSVGLLPLIFNTFDALSAFLPTDYDVMSLPQVLGEYGGAIISNRFALVEGLNLWYTGRNRNIWTRYLSSAAPWGIDGISREIAEVTTALRQLYSAESPPADYDNPYILGWRDFMTTRNVHPTNTADNALWIRGDGDDGAISVSGTVDFDEDALRDLLQSLEFQVKNSLSQPSLHVTIDNTNDLALADNPGRLYENVVNNSTTINNIASEVQGQQAEYEDPDWTLDDYGSLFDKSAEMRDWDFVGKWSKMFDDVSIEPPGPCKLWDGFAPNDGNDSGTPGPWGGWSQIIDVGSLYWYPMDSCGGLIRSIRGVFRALWTLVILFVIAGLVRINWLLARCGVRILIAVVSAFGSPDPMGAVVDVFETVLKALSQLYTGLFGGRPAESD